MDRNKILEKYKKTEERLMISKVLDKIQLLEKQNKIQYTDFLTLVEIKLIEKMLKSIPYKNFEIYGVIDNAQRNIIIFFPSKLENVFQENKFDYNTICNIIRITNDKEKMEHSIYLGGLMKLGIKREKVGDIIVHDFGADIIVSKDISKFLLSNLQQLIRFKNCEITVIDSKDVIKREQQFKEITITVSSLRIDNIVSDLSNSSRSGALELLKQEKVFINYQNEIKNTKIVKQDDIITIRGKGKFIIDEIIGTTRSGKFIIKVKKFI